MAFVTRTSGGLWTRRAALAGLAAAPFAAALAQEVVVEEHALAPGQFTWHPERSPSGAVAVIVSIPEQRVHVYRNGVRIALSTCSTGKPGHATPTGVFTVLQKDKHHRSATYGGAPMPNMNRLTWDGVALHAGELPGYPASHGCVRLPMAFSERLFTVTHIGTPVIIAGATSDPWELVHPGLVLGGGAQHEMADAVARLDARKHPADWESAAEYPVTTVLATGLDRRIVLIENGTEITEDVLAVSGSPRLGEHVFLLRGAEGGGGRMQWWGLTHHPDPGQPLAPETAVLDRLSSTRRFRAELAARMHPGMTFIVSDLAATPDRRSGADFVIMAADEVPDEAPPARLPVPRPVLRPHG
jgi:hypothetical protein